jgi:hypothetical protein
MVPDASELEAVMRYHERTKRHFNRYAAGPGEFDWANQPDPFRRYESAALTRLPVLGPEEEPISPAYESLYARGAVPGAPVNLRTHSRLLEYALALSACISPTSTPHLNLHAGARSPRPVRSWS